MKIFFDANVYVAEALLGEGAQRMVRATLDASWRIYSCSYVAAETQRVLAEKLGFSPRFAFLTRLRILRRAIIVEPGSSAHIVPDDDTDSPVLQSAATAKANYLITNDNDLLQLHPYEGLRIIFRWTNIGCFWRTRD